MPTSVGEAKSFKLDNAAYYANMAISMALLGSQGNPKKFGEDLTLIQEYNQLPNFGVPPQILNRKTELKYPGHVQLINNFPNLDDSDKVLEYLKRHIMENIPHKAMAVQTESTADNTIVREGWVATKFQNVHDWSEATNNIDLSNQVNHDNLYRITGQSTQSRP